MKIKNKKKPYSMPESSSLVMEGRESLLGSSVVTVNTYIESTGHEVGKVYDFSLEEDPNTGKLFNHEWETGTYEIK